ncbi:hypothetical protein AAG570_002554 [Ranatra chinensis]|uniref:Uncharacterized protein n=1 Tax=Ranatra chinensis TaxID=642074 RepID=A0ABD0Y8T7_9HEMI
MNYTCIFFGIIISGIHSLKVYDNTTTWHNFWQKKSAGSLGHGGQTEAQFGGEERIDYLREDPGLNDYLAQLTIFYPRWLDQAKYSKVKYFRRGELFYYVFYQLLARYSLERWANHMPRPDVLQWDHPIMVGYNPRVVHPSGHYMYPRPAKLVPSEVNPGGVWRTQRSEWKILEDIQSGVIFYQYTSGPAGIYLTTGRDPAFYMFLQRLMDIFRHHKDALPAYTKNDLLFPGVKIESFQTGKLITYFERSDIEATYGVRIPASDTFKDYHYHGSQMRLNHKPFLYNIVINVDRAVEAVVRIFLGPKTTPRGYPLTAEEARAYFFEFDRFTVKRKLLMNSGRIRRGPEIKFLCLEGYTLNITVTSRPADSCIPSVSIRFKSSFLCLGKV